MPHFGRGKSEADAQTTASVLASVSALAQTHARLKAWWTGEAALPSVAFMGDHGPDTTDVPADTLAQRAKASAALWAHGRTYPGTHALDCQIIAELVEAQPERLALFGGGGGAVAHVMGHELTGKIDCFERDPHVRTMAQTHLQKGDSAKRFGVHDFNGVPSSLPKSKVDAALFLFQGGTNGSVEACAFGAERILKPHGLALWFDFVADVDGEALDPCRGPEQRRFETAEATQSAFAACGLTCLADDDWTARFLDAYQLAWRDLSANLAVRQAVLIQQGGQAAGQAALADIITWKARADALRNGDLRVRRYQMGR